MDSVDYLHVRFHWGGKFKKYGSALDYSGGYEAMSFVDRDKISLPEIVGHLRDHCNVSDGVLLHWLPPGKQMKEGLRVLVDDKVCLYMSDCIVNGEVADIYIEEPVMEVISDDGEYTGEIGCQLEAEERLEDIYVGAQTEEIVPINVEEDIYVGSSSDSEYTPRDDCASEDDEEADQIIHKFKSFKKNLKIGQIAHLDDVVLDNTTAMTLGFANNEEDGNDTPYVETDSDESIEELDSDGQIKRKDNSSRRFNSRDTVPTFSLGMKFNSKKEFKEAIIKNGLAQRKVFKFIKDEPTRVRAKCDWAWCPWVCLCSKNSRTDSWQIATLEDTHTCPPRRDNKHVTARRIAEKYEKFILANPRWSFVRMQTTVQEEMFVNVSMTKLKRAKGMVMKKAMDSTKGQYEKTTSGGSATINLKANVPNSQTSSSVTINIKSGKAAAHVSAHEPPKKKTKPARKPSMPIMIMPPWQSDKL